MTKIDVIKAFLDQTYPNSRCELNYQRDYELLIAVLLSAQATDKAVNRVTVVLFKKYDTLRSLADAPLSDLENIIRPIGLSKTKARYVKEIANILVNDFAGKVPESELALLSMPGIGVKTKNCVLAELFQYPLFAVDTHVQRICKRLCLVDSNASVEVIEKMLYQIFPPEVVIKTNHQLIDFGRSICKAKKPNCQKCELLGFCKEKMSNCAII